MSDMSFLDAAREPRSLGIACATGAVMLGLACMAAAGAPLAYLGTNAAAVLIGLLMIGILKMAGAGRIWNARYWPGVLTMMIAAALLGTALFGVRADGAARWVRLGGLAIQPSLILLPVMMLVFARSRDALSTAAMVVAAAALALQPDRAMAGMLAAGLTALAVMRPDRAALTALAAALAGFLVSLARTDLLPATPYVDQVLYASFGVHVLAGFAVLGGLALLVLPAIVGVRRDLAHRHVHLVFGAVWVSATAAAALGNYPTPIVGYGGSAILGYFLSLAALPRLARPAAAQAMPDQGSDARPADRRLRVGLARS
jgi:cell division protein FtsW (lipid II flippase)